MSAPATLLAVAFTGLAILALGVCIDCAIDAYRQAKAIKDELAGLPMQRKLTMTPEEWAEGGGHAQD